MLVSETRVAVVKAPTRRRQRRWRSSLFFVLIGYGWLEKMRLEWGSGIGLQGWGL